MSGFGSIEQLESDLRAMLKDATSETVRTVQKKITFDLLAGVVRRTPVDEGRARGGWQVGVNEAPQPRPTPVDPGKKVGDPTGAALTAAIPKLEKLPDYAIVFLVNDVPYIVVLDQGLFDPANPGPSKDPRKGRRGKILVQGGFSTQAPAGMVDVTIASIAAEVAQS